MSGNTFGELFRLTTYGESHGPGLGAVLDGCPPGLEISEELIQAELDARRPGQEAHGAASTARSEKDRARILSGLLDGLTTGAPIALHIENTDQKPEDYSGFKGVLRPGHADLGYLAKYGIRDHRGGGRSSGRETVSRVAGGAIALAFLKTVGIDVHAFTLELGGITAKVKDIIGASGRWMFAPDESVIPAWEARIAECRDKGDSVGGLVGLRALGVPAGLGEPVFDKLDARIAYAMMGVGAVKSVGIGAGFGAARSVGSRNNDALLPSASPDRLAEFSSNNAGGVLGGISNGAPVTVTVAVKPIPSIAIEQKSVDIHGRPVRISVGGRHDVCAIPRVVPVLKAMLALTLADFVLLQRRYGSHGSMD